MLKKELLIAESALSCPPADMMVSSGDALLLACVVLGEEAKSKNNTADLVSRNFTKCMFFNVSSVILLKPYVLYECNLKFHLAKYDILYF